MAQFRVLSWNVEVFGPQRYGKVPNNVQRLLLIGQVVHETNANVVLIQEVMSSVAIQVAFNINEAITIATGVAWQHRVVPARPNGNRESYVVLWRDTRDAAANFSLVATPGGEAFGLAAGEFPNNFSATHGRKAVYAVFRTLDTNVNVAVTSYHAPPNAYAQLGVEAVASMPEIYIVNNAGALQPIGARLLAGDYNMRYNDPFFAPLTNALPAVPPPNLAAGQGAGTIPTNQDSSLLGTLNQAVAAWGPPYLGWGAASANYRRNGYEIDNVFSSVAPAASGVVDVVAAIMNAGPVPLIANPAAIRNRANAFVLSDPAGNPAFPNSQLIPLPLAASLNFAGCAFLFYRYGLSDHLPVLVQVNA